MEKSLHSQPHGRDAQKFQPAGFEHHKLSVNTALLATNPGGSGAKTNFLEADLLGLIPSKGAV